MAEVEGRPIQGAPTWAEYPYAMLAERYPALGRGVADIRDRVGWAKVRSRGIGASDAAKYSKEESALLYAKTKLYNPFQGNGYTQHGNEREPFMLRAYNIRQNHIMFRSEHNPRHLATPDGIILGGNGEIVLAQCKTTSKQFRTIPLAYKRQCWWEQYVMGAERTLFIWEVHENYRPLGLEPESEWIYRDDTEIDKMILISDLVLAALDAGDSFIAELEQEHGKH